MIIEFDLQGSKCLHKGIFDTSGFWVKYEPEYNKIYSHFSFSFYHEKKEVVDEVYAVLVGCMRGAQGRDIEGIGYLRRLNK